MVLPWFQYAAPQRFYGLAGRLYPFCFVLAALLGAVGLYMGFFVAPTDAQQGEAYRIIFIHVPASWMSMVIYCAMAFWSALGLGFKTRISGLMAQALAPTGALFCFLSLWTGALWGKPMWGTWWVWDARLTSMLVLFLLYISYITIVNSGSNILRAEKPASVMALIGFINIPIVKFSVDIWYSLHQPASILRVGGPSIHSSMLLPLMIMFTSFILYFILLLLIRTKLLLNRQKQNHRL